MTANSTILIHAHNGSAGNTSLGNDASATDLARGC